MGMRYGMVVVDTLYFGVKEAPVECNPWTPFSFLTMLELEGRSLGLGSGSLTRLSLYLFCFQLRTIDIYWCYYIRRPHRKTLQLESRQCFPDTFSIGTNRRPLILSPGNPYFPVHCSSDTARHSPVSIVHTIVLMAVRFSSPSRLPSLVTRCSIGPG